MRSWLWFYIVPNYQTHALNISRCLRLKHKLLNRKQWARRSRLFAFCYLNCASNGTLWPRPAGSFASYCLCLYATFSADKSTRKNKSQKYWPLAPFSCRTTRWETEIAFARRTAQPRADWVTTDTWQCVFFEGVLERVFWDCCIRRNCFHKCIKVHVVGGTAKKPCF